MFAQVVNSLILKVEVFATKIPNSFFEAGYVYQLSLVYVIVTTHVNWHMENLQSDRGEKKENTGNLKMKFEGYPVDNINDIVDFWFQVRRELQAQLARFRSLTGDMPLYLDGHNHIHVMPGKVELLGSPQMSRFI